MSSTLAWRDVANPITVEILPTSLTTASKRKKELWIFDPVAKLHFAVGLNAPGFCEMTPRLHQMSPQENTFFFRIYIIHQENSKEHQGDCVMKNVKGEKNN